MGCGVPSDAGGAPESGMDQGNHQVRRHGRSRLPSLEVGQAGVRAAVPHDQRTKWRRFGCGPGAPPAGGGSTRPTSPRRPASMEHRIMLHSFTARDCCSPAVVSAQNTKTFDPRDLNGQVGSDIEQSRLQQRAGNRPRQFPGSAVHPCRQGGVREELSRLRTAGQRDAAQRSDGNVRSAGCPAEPECGSRVFAQLVGD